MRDTALTIVKELAEPRPNYDPLDTYYTCRHCNRKIDGWWGRFGCQTKTGTCLGARARKLLASRRKGK